MNDLMSYGAATLPVFAGLAPLAPIAGGAAQMFMNQNDPYKRVPLPDMNKELLSLLVSNEKNVNPNAYLTKDTKDSFIERLKGSGYEEKVGRPVNNDDMLNLAAQDYHRGQQFNKVVRFAGAYPALLLGRGLTNTSEQPDPIVDLFSMGAGTVATDLLLQEALKNNWHDYRNVIDSFIKPINDLELPPSSVVKSDNVVVPPSSDDVIVTPELDEYIPSSDEYIPDLSDEVPSNPEAGKPKPEVGKPITDPSKKTKKEWLLKIESPEQARYWAEQLARLRKDPSEITRAVYTRQSHDLDEEGNPKLDKNGKPIVIQTRYEKPELITEVESPRFNINRLLTENVIVPRIANKAMTEKLAAIPFTTVMDSYSGVPVEKDIYDVFGAIQADPTILMDLSPNEAGLIDKALNNFFQRNNNAPKVFYTEGELAAIKAGNESTVDAINSVLKDTSAPTPPKPKGTRTIVADIVDSALKEGFETGALKKAGEVVGDIADDVVDEIWFFKK